MPGPHTGQGVSLPALSACNVADEYHFVLSQVRKIHQGPVHDHSDWSPPSLLLPPSDWGVLARTLDSINDVPDFEWLVIDAIYINVPSHGDGACGDDQSNDGPGSNVLQSLTGNKADCLRRWVPSWTWVAPVP